MINLSIEKKAKWVAGQLEGCGFPTTLIGISWGYWTKSKSKVYVGNK